MCHLTKDTAVRAGDTLDSAVGTVDIPVLVVGQVSVDIAVAVNIYGEQDLKIFESGVAYFK